MAEKRILGLDLSFDERITLAQLTNHPGWRILVKLMAESCRNATEEVIKLNPTEERYEDKLAKLQMTARAMSKFSNEVLGSVKEHLQATVQAANGVPSTAAHTGRFKGFGPPQSPPEGEQ